MFNLHSPNEEKLPLTRELINEFAEKFENTRYAEDGEAIRRELSDELLYHYRSIESYIHVVEKDGLYGVYHDLLGVMLVPAIYEELSPMPSCCERLVWRARSNGKYGLVKADGQGTPLTLFDYDMIAPLYDEEDVIGPYVFRCEDKMGLLGEYCDDSVILALPAEYDNIEVYPGTSYIQLCKDGKVGLYGSLLYIPPIYDAVYVPQHFGWIKVKQHGRWGYINSKGNFTEDINAAFLYR